MKTKIAITFLFFTCAFLGRSFANPGDLDTTFGNGGVYVDAPSEYPCYGFFPTAIALQADGKILVSGKAYDKCNYNYLTDPENERRLLIRRFNSDGTPDMSFGLSGFGGANFLTGSLPYGYASDVIVQPDGRIVVAGTKVSRTGTVATLWRFSPQGVIDQTFGTNGVVSFTMSGANNSSQRLAIWNGQILVAGYSGGTSLQLWIRKLNTNGSTDTLFAQGTGKITTSLKPYIGRVGFSINPTNGHIFLGGYVNSSSDMGMSSAVAKFFPDGTLYANFGNFGTSVLPNCEPGAGNVTTYPIAAADIRFQSNGKILVSSVMYYGYFAMASGVHRLVGNGAVDTTFGDPAQPQMCNAMFANQTWIRTLPSDFFYMGTRRYFPDGPYDTSFSQNTIAGGISAQIQPADGKIVHLTYESILKPDQSGFDTQVKLFRLLPQ